jgi:hypothetical protein
MTSPVPVRSALDGPQITIDTFLNDPLRIQALVFQAAAQQFLADALLRMTGPLKSNAVQYFTSTPFYSDSNAGKRAEFAEVPVAVGSYGTPAVTYVAERALAILISDAMKRWQNIDQVNTQLAQVRNTLVKTYDDAFIAALLAANTQVVSGSAWGTATTASAIRNDLIEAMKLVATAAAPGQNTAFGFTADTLVIGQGRQFDLIRQEDFNKPYVGNIASENLLYTGKLPNKIMGLDVVVSRALDDSKAIVMQRKVSGFIADDLPLQASGLYRDEPRKTWRCDVQRSSAIGFDQPLSMALIDIS